MKNSKSVIRGFLLITQLGLGIIAPIFLCVYIGWFLDTRFGIHGMLWMLLLGFLAGGRNGWLLVRQALKEDEKESEGEKDGQDSDGTDGGKLR